jgi:anti-anti-sigma factor
MFEIRTPAEGRAEMIGRLDAAESEAADRAFKALQGPLVLDCTGLEYISSAGLGVLIELHKRLASSGQTLTLTHLGPRVRNVFMYAGLDRLLKIE